MIRVLDTIVSPGVDGRGGDDRLGFDEAAGVAWVVDGATDVGPLRLFETGESDAAVYADALSARLLTPPAALQSGGDYWRGVLTDMRDFCATHARTSIDTAPRHMLPSAAVAWVGLGPQRQEVDAPAELDFFALGDAMLLVREPSGAVTVYGNTEKVEAEAAHAAAMARAADPDARRAVSQAARAQLNTPDGYWIASVHPEAADHALALRLTLAPGAVGLLLTDGLYRLVAPYGLMSPAEVMEVGVEMGLGNLISRLRAHEAASDHAGRAQRTKLRDDATGLVFCAPD